jgi:hypothetical protein
MSIRLLTYTLLFFALLACVEVLFPYRAEAVTVINSVSVESRTGGQHGDGADGADGEDGHDGADGQSGRDGESVIRIKSQVNGEIIYDFKKTVPSGTPGSFSFDNHEGGVQSSVHGEVYTNNTEDTYARLKQILETIRLMLSLYVSESI